MLALEDAHAGPHAHPTYLILQRQVGGVVRVAPARVQAGKPLAEVGRRRRRIVLRSTCTPQRAQESRSCTTDYSRGARRAAMQTIGIAYLHVLTSAGLLALHLLATRLLVVRVPSMLPLLHWKGFLPSKTATSLPSSRCACLLPQQGRRSSSVSGERKHRSQKTQCGVTYSVLLYSPLVGARIRLGQGRSRSCS